MHVAKERPQQEPAVEDRVFFILSRRALVIFVGRWVERRKGRIQIEYRAVLVMRIVRPEKRQKRQRPERIVGAKAL